MQQKSMILVAVAAAALAGCGGHPSETGSSGAPAASTPMLTTSGTDHASSVTAAPSTSASASGSASALPPTSTADVFVLLDAAGDVKVYSATTGAVIRTVVTGSPATAGRTFAVVGSSGRFVYFIDATGPARVPLTGGPLQRLPQPETRGTAVRAIYANRADTRFEETVGTADDGAPTSAVVLSTGSATVTSLGSGSATGWNPAGTTAYVTTSSTTPYANNQVGTTTLTITGHDPATGKPDAYREAQTSQSPGDDGACGGPSTATAIGPTGQIGWALGGCSTAQAGRPSYTFRATEQLSLAGVPLPASDDGFYVTTFQYTPAGTAVFTFTHQDCTGSTPIAVVRGNGTSTANLPGHPSDC